VHSSFDDDISLQALLAVLADGCFHSGQELGEILGVSRAAVWKQLQKLEPLGIRLQSVKGKGYCLEGGLELLSASSIVAGLDPLARQLLAQLDIHPVIDSTNAQALRDGLTCGSGYTCLAEFQTAGRGRRGRTWVSPFGKNIYLSLLWTFDGGAAELEGLSLAIGVTIAEVLQRLGVSDIQLKWPNDVLWRKRKLAGILLEMTGDPAGVCQVVVGIGVNVAMPAEAADSIDQPWVDMRSILNELNLPAESLGRNQLVAALLSELLPLLSRYQLDRFASYRMRWETLNAYAGKTVEVRMANSEVVGELLGVNEAGALRLQTAAGEQLFYGGEISLRVAS
jgi:BirA family biotin operon repressor/biotin-[acetyl-CoA-carboxylase] ligase